MDSKPICYIEYRKESFSDHASHVSNENGPRSSLVSPEHIHDLNAYEILETFTCFGHVISARNSSHVQLEFLFYKKYVFNDIYEVIIGFSEFADSLQITICQLKFMNLL